MKDPTIEGATMATLPDMPVNTALTVGAVAAMGLIAYTQTLRTRVETQVHDNYRTAKLVDAGMQPETPVHLARKSDRSAS